MICRQELRPVAGSLLVALQALRRTPFKDGGVQQSGIKLQHFHQVFPRPFDHLFLEIIAERPVAQHLEHRMMIGVMPHFLQVVMLSAHAQAFLRIRHAGIFDGHIPQNNVLELVHSRIGKHQCRVTFNNHRCGRHNLMPLGGKERFE
ncbi:hypothetical protein Barb7_00554 [Bacteroidales bacterium Barb7]|nr:hypothetical protein Barb7_00554 [Bacteroidales bacterium Barb7]